MCVVIPAAVMAAAAAVSAVTAVAGGVISYTQGQNAAAAAKSAQSQAAASQNSAFMARAEAQREQLQGQTSVNNAANQRFNENQAAQQASQMQSLQDRENTTTGINQQEQAISTQRDQAVNQGTQSANAQALTDAQNAQLAQQQAMNVPGQGEVQATNPLGAADTGVTKDALDARLGAADKYVTKYGDTLAQLSSYNAPIATANNAATTIGTNLMPAGAADQLLKTSAPALLAPSTTAYQQAGAYGQALKDANALTTQGALALEQTKAQNAEALANLGQSDDAARIQGTLNVKQADAAAGAAMGNGLSTLGGLGLSFAASRGAFGTNPFGISTPIVAPVKVATA